MISECEGEGRRSERNDAHDPKPVDSFEELLLYALRCVPSQYMR